MTAPANAVPRDEIHICNETGYTLGGVYLKTLYNISVDTAVWFSTEKDLKDGYCREYKAEGSSYHFFYHNNNDRVSTPVKPGIEYVIDEDSSGTLYLYR